MPLTETQPASNDFVCQLGMFLVSRKENLMFWNRALITAIATAMICSAAAAKADQILYCTDELSTGFIKKDGGWRITNFTLDRFTLKVEGDFEALIHGGDRFSCVERWAFSGDSPIFCNNDVHKSSSITMDKDSLRYVLTETFGFGFVSSKLDRPDTDSISAGTCETF